jgi:hypothetical protein
MAETATDDRHSVAKKSVIDLLNIIPLQMANCHPETGMKK